MLLANDASGKPSTLSIEPIPVDHAFASQGAEGEEIISLDGAEGTKFTVSPVTFNGADGRSTFGKVVNGKTLRSDGAAVTVDGRVVSLAQDGKVVVNSKAVTVTPTPRTTPESQHLSTTATSTSRRLIEKKNGSERMLVVDVAWIWNKIIIVIAIISLVT